MSEIKYSGTLLAVDLKNFAYIMEVIMKILFINKFLYQKGGSETYLFNLADYLKAQGHSIDYFGMQDDRNIAKNSLELSVSNMEFKGSSIDKVLYPFKIIYSQEARKKIKAVLKAAKPDIIHLNNYNFQITPSILYEIKNYNIPVVMTLHDFQVVCPNHMMYLASQNKICEECKGRKYINCAKNKCIHNSRLKSMLAAFEGAVYYSLQTYEKYIDLFIAPSSFIKNKFVEFGESESKIKVLHNFTNNSPKEYTANKQKYILYFGRLSAEKGINTLIKSCKKLPHIQFKFVGSGELEDRLKGTGNIEYLGFKSGEELNSLIREALFSVYPSEWYENCPMSVLESQMYGTPVIGADIGGIPELIRNNIDGLLFTPGNAEDLTSKIGYLYENSEVLGQFSINCMNKAKDFSIEKYYTQLMKYYDMTMEKHKGGMVMSG
ncbi:MAG: hypothetical protein K0R50_1517 [Eubacterium sp.]|jgi:glycosyltransferase involved in cell wall biosynthesis|nr:hypothetical protein [Eubacterium sp.]